MEHTHYLLRDSNEVFGIFDTIEYAYTYLLQFIYHFYRYNKKYIELCLDNFQIIQYTNNNIINIFIINSNYKLFNNNMQLQQYSNITISDLLLKLNNINKNGNNKLNTKVNTDNTKLNINTDNEYDKNMLEELNLFIPMSETENIINHENNLNDEIKELQQQIETLNTIKQNETSSLIKIKDNLKIQEEQYFFNRIKNESIKQKIEFKKESYEKIFNKFKIDMDIYFKIKNEIQNGDRSDTNLPLLFIDEYKVFLYLDQNNLLNNENHNDIFNEYIKHKPDKIEKFVSNYDNIFDNVCSH